jgi:hypothetical protein
MAAWSAMIALSLFNYSGVEKKFSITSAPGNYFWSNGYSWGNAKVSKDNILISVHYGKLELKSLQVSGRKNLNLKKPVTINENGTQEFKLDN